jgi:osmotically-inducible protein OsmY
VLDAWVNGVESVNGSGLEVRDWAGDPHRRQSVFADVPDDAIASAVEDALRLDAEVDSSGIEVTVEAGLVMLRGSVPDLRGARAAARDARSTVGVRSVVTRIRVTGRSPLSDDNLAEAIRAGLARDPFVERYKVAVEVIDRVAYLRGTVDSFFEKARADDAASSILGIREVRNFIEVASLDSTLVWNPYLRGPSGIDYDWFDTAPFHTSASDTEIRSRIESQLWWSPVVDELQVEVDVTDGVATLTGTADSWVERAAATQNAYEGGATWVDNDLEVE